MLPHVDEDVMFAAINLVERTGAKQLQFGHLHDDVPVHLAAWWATASYQGAKITEENHVGPVEALEALARRLLTGAMCKNCGGLVALSDDGALAFNGTLVDGTPWKVEDARSAGQCRWRRLGARWEPGCQTKNRETRRAERKKNRRT